MTSSTDGGQPLAGRLVVVTRAAAQAGELSTRLRALGAEVVEVAAIAIEDPSDGGAALQRAVEDIESYDWVIVTSPNGADRLAAALADRPSGPAGAVLGTPDRVRRAVASREPAAWPVPGPRLAVVGPGTVAAAERAGLPVAFVPERFVGESLVEAFPDGPGLVLLAQAEGARAVVAEGLAAKGWSVETVAAYRTVPTTLPPALVAEVRRADAITFASGSAARHLVAATGLDALPAIVVCIGPVTAQEARLAGAAVTAVASPHDLDGLVAAVVTSLR